VSEPRVLIAPTAGNQLAPLIEASGGRVVDEAKSADAIVWTDPGDPKGLKRLLAKSSARWVQLPFAGIESFFAAGVIDPARIWTCAKGIYGPATAEHALALTLAAARRLHVHARLRTWTSNEKVGSGFGAAETRLKGRTVVVVGTGGIGRAYIDMVGPLEPDLVAVNRSGSPVDGVAETLPIERLDDVLPRADFVVLALSLTPESRRMFDTRRLALMKPTAWIVNVARGGVIDTEALVEALREGRLGGAALDVTEPEPLPDGHPLWSLPNALVTPHVANTWDMAVPELAGMVARNVEHFAAGEALEGLVDPELGY
jgi:D-3-phosphoglycerate dehydrogenase